VDIGGTFTDACAISTADGTIYTAKSRSTPDDLIRGLLDALELVAGQVGISRESLLAETVKFGHATTQTSNVLFTWVGARTGLLTTRGFADEILIMRARGRVAGLSLSERRHLRATRKPPQIVPRDLIEEVSERVDRQGHVVTPLTEREADRAVDALLAKGVESVAVSLLWSPENPGHEQMLARVLREKAPNLHVSLSHELAPVTGEYERAATTVVNAFVAPTVERYLRRLVKELEALGLRVPLLVVQASGGVTQVEDTVAVNTVESGPAAGMVAVKALAEATGHPNVIATDVGGTTFKAGLLLNGEWTLARETIINQYSLLAPMVELASIGAGGGSIAWADDNRLRIGPQSAGADPGPACYGWGGTEPTVTDADLVLGFLNAERFLSGRLRLRTELAEKAMAKVADPLFGGDVVAAAAGIRQVVDAQMGDLVRKMSIERGHDPRSFALVAYGGAGPLHAAGYARGIGVRTIIVPHAATAYSAYGAAASDVRQSLQRSVRRGLLNDDAELERAYAGMEKEIYELMRRQGIEDDAVKTVRWADMRFERQLHDVRVSLAEQDSDGSLSNRLIEAFTQRYAVLYGDGAVLVKAAPRLLRIGVDATGSITKPELPTNPLDQASSAHAKTHPREVFWPEQSRWISTDIYDGTLLRPGNRLHGPAIVELPGTTVVVPDGGAAEIDAIGNLIITLGQEGAKP
jgi:N-methylhydantoinase A